MKLVHTYNQVLNPETGNNLAKEFPRKLSQLLNDCGFITESGTSAGNVMPQNNSQVVAGRWEPVANNQASDVPMLTANGTYIKMGNTVILNFTIAYQTSSAVEELAISGLPFAPKYMRSWRGGSGYIQGFANQSTHSFAGWLVDKTGVIHARGFAYADGSMSKIKVGASGWVDATGIIMYDVADKDMPIKSINHRGYSAIAPENTIPAYIKSAERGYKYVECDVAFTKDDVAVLLHDDTIDRTSNGAGRIEQLMYNDLLDLDFGYSDAFGNQYKGTKIPSMDEFLACCKSYELHPYIEFKSGGSYTERQIQKVVDLVVANGMINNCSFISFNLTYLGYVRDYCPTARLGYLANTLVDNDFGTWQQRLNSLRTENNDVFFDVRHDLVPDVIDYCKTNLYPIEIWTVNDEDVIKNMDSYISGVTSDNLIVDDVLNLDGTFEAPNLSDSNILHYIPRSGFSQRALSSSYPYQATQTKFDSETKRLSYVGAAIVVPANTAIRLEIDGRVPLNCACWQITSSGVNKINTNGAFTSGDIIDSSWQTNGYELTTNDDCKYLWLNVRRQDNAAITLADINWFKITKV